MKYPYKQYKLSTFSIPDSHSTSDIVLYNMLFVFVCIQIFTSWHFLLLQILKPAQPDRRKMPFGGNQRPNTPPRGAGNNNKKGKK